MRCKLLPTSSTGVGLTGDREPSQPGTSPADMLVELKQRLPPKGGVTYRGSDTFYGGTERWAVEIGRRQVTVGVIWPIQQSPEQGTGIVYLAKPRR